jgi:peptidoglycan/LPS O-acetylase OafA/YrhL
MTYRKDIDALKGLSIIAVVLYHIGLLKSGYLGVDIFFVINGFLIIPGLCSRVGSNEFRYFAFLRKRVIRLLPLVVLASMACLIIGYFGMLPDNYENLAESVAASNLFSENILSAITTKNYWNAANDYKPLMHLWYVGVLFEFYLVFPIILLISKWIAGRMRVHSQNFLPNIVAAICLFSLILYLLPYFSESEKFYYIPFRLFELSFGGLAGIYYNEQRNKTDLNWMWITFLTFLIFSSVLTFDLENIGNQMPVIGGGSNFENSGLIAHKSTLLILVVLMSSIVLSRNNSSYFLLRSKVLSEIGKRSYSIFVWHQLFLAFYRYFVTSKVTIPFLIGYVILLVIISELSYKLVEKRVKDDNKSLAIWVSLSVLTMVTACFIYFRAGVVRDVPEQNITVGNVHRNMHAEYVDRVYKYDKDFPDNKKMNVLVEGVSFGRDFANCLLESSYADSVNISYVHKWTDEAINRIRVADFIFTFSAKDKVPQYVWHNKKASTEVWGIGTKNYGECNGIIYSHRYADDYLSTTIDPNPDYMKLNSQWKMDWGDNYIDFMGLAMDDSNRIRVFTPEGKFISQDCEHLTEEGARWYASLIPWESVLKVNE